MNDKIKEIAANIIIDRPTIYEFSEDPLKDYDSLICLLKEIDYNQNIFNRINYEKVDDKIYLPTTEDVMLAIIIDLKVYCSKLFKKEDYIVTEIINIPKDHNTLYYIFEKDFKL